MRRRNAYLIPVYFLLLFFLSFNSSHAQQITGVWHGKIDNRKVEVKIIQKGDSLTGTSYYYQSPTQYQRYSIKGYFDQDNNSVVWWDDQLIESKAAGAEHTYASVADFNCPGGGQMYLDGKTSPKNTGSKKQTAVALTKNAPAIFQDEWNFVIDNYTVGANDPELIDSVTLIALLPRKMDPKPAVFIEKNEPTVPKIERVTAAVKKEAVATPAATALTIEQKFTSRKKVLTTERPLAGDSIELRFYDNAQIDGDSISLFLNNRLLFTNIRLTDKAYIIKLPVADLLNENELIMVAENLGAIPPNTSYMVAIVADKRYEAQLASTEHSSAAIRLYK
jgi:hypothetical protein